MSVSRINGETTVSTTLLFWRCDSCLIPFAVPFGFAPVLCPRCERKARNEAEEYSEQLIEEQAVFERRIAALRGVIARMKRGVK